MKKQIIVAFFCLSLSLVASELSVNGGSSMVKTALPTLTKSVYLGSFLAQGHIPATQVYRIDTPVEGVIETLNANIYEIREKNSLLAIIKSPKLLELEATYINFLIEEEYNENEVARLKPLYEAAVVAKKQYFKAQNSLAKYKTQTKFYYHLLQEWGLSQSQVEMIKKTKKPIASIKIFAPISGKISDLNIFPKMYLQRGEHMMTILNEKKAHLEVALPLNIAKKLQPGFKLFIGDTPVEVESIAAQIDTRTQTLAVHLLPKKSMDIMSNEKKNIKLFWPRSALKVPASAIIKYQDKSALFVKDKSRYRLVYVDVLGRSSGNVYLFSKNLHKNDEIAISGVISLK